MKIRIALAMAIALLSGCKSISSIKSSPPVLQGNTAKSMDEFGMCVATDWADTTGMVSTLPFPGGKTIALPQAMGGYDAVLDMTQKSDKVEWKLYLRTFVLTDWVQRSVQGCT